MRYALLSPFAFKYQLIYLLFIYSFMCYALLTVFALKYQLIQFLFIYSLMSYTLLLSTQRNFT